MAISKVQLSQIALRHLRSYYRFRSRAGQMTSRSDMQTAKGAIIDALITFDVTEAQSFVAALEVSGMDEADEVMYQLNTRKLMWDCVAFSFMTLALLSSIGFAYDLLAVKKAGWIGIAIALDVFALVFFSVFYAFMKKSARYRIIHAIEQFKQYQADEQWIVIDESIFQEKSAEYYTELKRQCVISGIGLMVAHQEDQLQILMTPTRVREEHLKVDLSQFIPIPEKGTQILSQLTHTMTQNKKDIKFYQQGRYSIQKLVTFTSILFILVLIFREVLLQPDMNYSENDVFKNSQKKKIDGAETDEHLYEVKADGSSAYVNFEDGSATSIGDENPDLYVWTPSGFFEYECERIHDELRNVYIVKDSEFKTFEAAKERIESIRKTGLSASTIAFSCISSDKTGYLVFIDWLFEEEAEANEALIKAQKELEKNNAVKNPLMLLEFK